MPLITKVKLKSGTIYELGRPWPVEDKEEGGKGVSLVGLIRLCPAEGEQDDDGSVTMPPRYEIWCVPKSLLDNFFNPVQRALFKMDPKELQTMVDRQILIAEDLDRHKIVHKRNVYLSQVAYDQEDWPTNDALTEVRETVLDPAFAPDDEEEAEPEFAPEIVPTNGEAAKPAEPVT